LLGHPNPADCPNATLTDVVVAEASDIRHESTGETNRDPNAAATVETAADMPEFAPPSGVALGAGTALTVEQASALAGKAGARLVWPVGPVESGKTTLIVGLYERYLQGPWADTSFAWSETLLDLEMLAFPSRLRSGADLPTTWRTRLRNAERQILHLRLSCPDSERVDLLFGNSPGENFNHVRDGDDPRREFPLLPDADYLLVCLDGEKVASPGTYDIAIGETRQFLGTLAQAAMLRASCVGALVLTKLDKVKSVDGGTERSVRAMDALAEDMERLGVATTSVVTSARHPAGTVEEDGMPELLRLIIGPPTEHTPALNLEGPVSTRSMDRFTGGEPS
jgi:hypothetical protein